MSKYVKGSVDWDAFDQFEDVIDKYMPARGEGDTLASQLVTAVNKIIYKWYNDGDVFDNTYVLDGWANDLSDYANWIDKHVPLGKYVLEDISNVESEGDYEELLFDLAKTCLDEDLLADLAKQPADGSIYNCAGPYKFEEYRDDDEDNGLW